MGEQPGSGAAFEQKSDRLRKWIRSGGVAQRKKPAPVMGSDRREHRESEPDAACSTSRIFYKRLSKPFLAVPTGTELKMRALG